MNDAQQMIYDTFYILVQWAMKYTRQYTIKSEVRIAQRG